jgi:diguanylate cyclase (GGDEF)-like protein
MRRLTRPQATLLVAAGLVGVGLFDYGTGVDIRVFPLYFIPLALAARRLGRGGALLASLAASLIWLAAMYFGGRHYPEFWYWAVNFLTQGSAFVVVTLLVAELERHLQFEYRQSRIDQLTGLLNSRAFLEAGPALLATNRRGAQALTLAYIDLDHFKQVNDRLGHQAGDEVLERVGEVMQRELPPAALIARMGGDEFAVLLPDVDIDEARTLLDRLRARLLADERIGSAGVSASIGAIFHRPGGPEFDALMRRADALMYEVKASGRDAVRVAEYEG